jgi:uncharacterized protein YpmB
MRLKKIYLFSIILFLILMIGLIFLNAYSSKSNTPREKTLLEHKGNFLGIAEKSVANRQAIVEFQKYEILGDKAMVMRNCMEENGFEENPLWVNEKTKVIQQKAKDGDISEDAVLENLKKEAIYSFTNSDHQPLYWRLKQSK